MNLSNSSFQLLILLLIIAISTHSIAEDISGTVSGILTTDNSPYILIDDINVEDGDSLIIEPGVEIRYDGRFYIHVDGYLEAIGTEEDSILFVPNGEDEDAGGLGLWFHSATPGSRLSYFRISGMRGDTRNRLEGSAITVSRSMIEITHGTVSDNFCLEGAVIHVPCNPEGVLFSDLLIEGNSSPGSDWGAGMNMYGDVKATIENCTFRNNSIEAGIGAAITSCSSSDELIIRGNIFEGNVANHGGAVYLMQSSALIEDNLFIENRAVDGNGGGLYIHASRWGNRDPVLIRNRFIRNQAANSGGAYLSARNRIVIMGNEFIENEAEISNGAFGANKVSFFNGLIYDNHAPSAGAIGGSNIDLVNSIVWGNEADENRAIIQVEGLLTLYCDIQGAEEEDGNVDCDPLFVNPEEFDFTLREDSPLIDTGHAHHLFNDPDSSRSDIGSHSGSGFAAAPLFWNFGDVWYPNSATVDFSLWWFGQDPLNLNVPAMETGDHFTVSQREPFSIEPYSLASFDVEYSPPQRGEFSDRMFLTLEGHDEDASPIMVVQGICETSVIEEFISGDLIPERSPYRIIDNTWIPEGEVLRIQAGVRIDFAGNYALRTRGGSFFIEGSEEDPVVITSINENRQGIIYFEGPAEPVRIDYLHINNTRGITVFGDLILEHSVINENGIDGRAVIVNRGMLTANNCIFSSNGLDIETHSGAIYIIRGSLSLDNCTFTTNVGTSGAGVCAGLANDCVLQNCIFEDNHSTRGGAIYCDRPIGISLINNTFIENRADRFGGAVHIAKIWPEDVEAQTEHQILFHNNRWIDNRAEGTGGGLNIEVIGDFHQPNIIQGDLFVGNEAGYGGGAFIKGYNGEISNTVFYANVADTGGGVYAESDELRLLNSILWANTAEEGDQIHERLPLDIEYSCIEGGFDGEGNIDENPRFADVEEDDFHLNEDSPCIDTGLETQFDRDIDGTRNDMGSHGGGRILLSTHAIQLPTIWIEQRAAGLFKLFNPTEDDFHIDEINITQEEVFSLDAEVPTPIESGQTYNMMLIFQSEEVGDFESEISIISEDFNVDQPGILSIFGSSIVPTNFITLRNGWSMISTNLLPEDNLIQTLFANLVERERLLIVKDENGQFYLPMWDFDNIERWLQGRGYLVKVTDDDQLAIVGEQIPVDTPIPLTEGWNIAAYYPLVEMSPYIALENIDDFVILAKDGSGHFYSPAFGFTNLTFRPTRGYHIKVEEDCELTYPEGERELIELNRAQGMITNHFPEPTRTDRNMSVLIEAIDYTGGVEPLEIGAFTPSGILFGSGVVESGRCGLAVWGDDPSTEHIDGFVEGEDLTFRIWDGKTEYPANISSQTNLPVYETDGMMDIELTPLSQINNPAGFEITSLSPNPFNSSVKLQYSLTKDSDVHFAVYNIVGQMIFYQDERNLKAGLHSISIDASKMASGVYFASIEAEGVICTVKLLSLR